MTAYAEEGLEKKISRYLFWKWVQEYLSPSAFLKGRYLALASREAGDASVLLGLGVPASRIILAEQDPEACRAAKTKFPGIACYQEDVLLTAHRYAREFTGIFLDYCGPSTSTNMFRSELVAETGLAPSGILGVNVFIGREVDFSARLEVLTEKYREDANPAFRARAAFMTEYFRKSSRVRLHPRAHMHYVARRGSIRRPMCTYMGARVALRPDLIRITPEVISSVLQHLLEPAQVARAPLLLNVPKTSIPGFRAHLSRGTY